MIAIVLVTAIGVFIVINNVFSTNSPSSSGSNGYVEIVPQGLEKKYKVGQTINFQVLIQGMGKYPCVPPNIVIYNNDDKEKPVFSYVTQAISCPSSAEHYGFYFPNQDRFFSTVINQTGDYTLDISIGNDSYEKQFSVTSNNNTAFQ